MPTINLSHTAEALDKALHNDKMSLNDARKLRTAIAVDIESSGDPEATRRMQEKLLIPDAYRAAKRGSQADKVMRSIAAQQQASVDMQKVRVQLIGAQGVEDGVNDGYAENRVLLVDDAMKFAAKKLGVPREWLALVKFDDVAGNKFKLTVADARGLPVGPKATQQINAELHGEWRFSLAAGKRKLV